MKKYLAFLILGLVFALPTTVLAQQNAQNSGGLQSPSSNTQDTRTLQTPVTPTQGGSSTFLEAQPGSLGVVSSPSQQTPSVTVGVSSTRTDVSEEEPKKNSPWPMILIIAGLVVIFWYIYRKVSRTPISVVANFAEEAPKEAKHPNQVTKAGTEQPKKKSTSKKSSAGQRTKKKNKKRTHR